MALCVGLTYVSGSTVVKKLIWHSYNKEDFGSYLGNKGRDKVILKWLSNKRRKNALLLLVYRPYKSF